MTAGLVAMELFDEAAVAALNKLAQYTRDQIGEAIRIADIPACVSGDGSMFRVHMKPEVPLNYRAAYVSPEELKSTHVLLDHLFDNGMMLINTCSGALSTVMTRREIDILAEAMLGGFRKIKASMSIGE
jgi:glutamate-1-semialdehyde 2,1-aminomutase